MNIFALLVSFAFFAPIVITIGGQLATMEPSL